MKRRLRIGDLVTLKSGGPVCMVVDHNADTSFVTVAWENQRDEVVEMAFRATVFRGIGDIEPTPLD